MITDTDRAAVGGYDDRRAVLLREERSIVHRNRRRARVIVAAAGILPGAVLGVILGILLGLVAGVVVAVAVAAAVMGAVWATATKLVLGWIRARPMARDREPRLENIVDGLCATFGLRFPDLAIVDDAVPNSCALGRGPADATLVVTSGLLETLEVIELEAVLAHELAHIKRDDIVVTTIAAAILGLPARLFGDDRWLLRAVGAGRETFADDVAVTVVRYPPGLQRALEAMQSAPPPAPGSFFADKRSEPLRALWVDPDVGRRDRDVQGRLDATGVRAAILAEH